MSAAAVVPVQHACICSSDPRHHLMQKLCVAWKLYIEGLIGSHACVSVCESSGWQRSV